MTSSYEQRIVEAMLRRAEALERGDDNAAAEALVEAGSAATALRTRRHDQQSIDALDVPTLGDVVAECIGRRRR